MPETPKDKLKKMTAWDTEPSLLDAEIDELLTQSGLSDPTGNSPEHEDWEPTYDLNAAAVAGWLIKAGRASSTTETGPETFYITSKIFDNCIKMASVFSAKKAGSVPLRQ
jgi:hypothetical protein